MKPIREVLANSIATVISEYIDSIDHWTIEEICDQCQNWDLFIKVSDLKELLNEKRPPEVS